MKTKAIAYSYASSPNAKRFKLRNGGYCVEIIKYNPERQAPVAVAGFATIEQASAWAEERPEAWDKFTLRAG